MMNHEIELIGEGDDVAVIRTGRLSSGSCRSQGSF
jgi:hypothetical protein